MHELSLAEEVIRIAEAEAKKHKAISVNEINIEVGNRSGVDSETFESVLMLISKGSVLDKSKINIITTKGKGICSGCSIEYEMENLIDECPECHSFPAEIKGGNEFRIISLQIDVDDDT